MKKIFWFLILVFSPGLLPAQVSSLTEELGVRLARFYQLLEKPDVTVDESVILLGDSAMLVEKRAFMEQCIRSGRKENCDTLMAQMLGRRYTCKSFIFKQLQVKKDLFFSKHQSSAEATFNSSTFSYKESPSDLIIEWMLEDGRSLYFVFNWNKDGHLVIGQVYLPSGESIYNVVNENKRDFFKQVGLIKNADSVQIVDQPNARALKVATLYKGELLLYTPSYQDRWWRVYSYMDKTFLGYMRADKILAYTQFSKMNKSLLLPNPPTQQADKWWSGYEPDHVYVLENDSMMLKVQLRLNGDKKTPFGLLYTDKIRKTISCYTGECYRVKSAGFDAASPDKEFVPEIIFRAKNRDLPFEFLLNKSKDLIKVLASPDLERRIVPTYASTGLLKKDYSNLAWEKGGAYDFAGYLAKSLQKPDSLIFNGDVHIIICFDAKGNLKRVIFPKQNKDTSPEFRVVKESLTMLIYGYPQWDPIYNSGSAVAGQVEIVVPVRTNWSRLSNNPFDQIYRQRDVWQIMEERRPRDQGRETQMFLQGR